MSQVLLLFTDKIECARQKWKPDLAVRGLIIRNLSWVFNVQPLGAEQDYNYVETTSYCPTEGGLRMITASRKPEAAQEGRRSAFLQPHLANSLLGGILLLSLCLSACGGSDPRPASARASVAVVVPVSVATAERRDIPYYLSGLGSVTAYYTVSVKSRVDGELMQVNFKEGQNVQKGELLALIDPRPYQVALDQAQAMLF